MMLSGTIKFYSELGVLLHRRTYYTKDGRDEAINEFINILSGKELGFYYHILPNTRIVFNKYNLANTKTIERPPAIYTNSANGRYKYD